MTVLTSDSKSNQFPSSDSMSSEKEQGMSLTQNQEISYSMTEKREFQFQVEEMVSSTNGNPNHHDPISILQKEDSMTEKQKTLASMTKQQESVPSSASVSSSMTAHSSSLIEEPSGTLNPSRNSSIFHNKSLQSELNPFNSFESSFISVGSPDALDPSSKNPNESNSLNGGEFQKPTRFLNAQPVQPRPPQWFPINNSAAALRKNKFRPNPDGVKVRWPAMDSVKSALGMIQRATSAKKITPVDVELATFICDFLTETMKDRLVQPGFANNVKNSGLSRLDIAGSPFVDWLGIGNGHVLRDEKIRRLRLLPYGRWVNESFLKVLTSRMKTIVDRFAYEIAGRSAKKRPKWVWTLPNGIFTKQFKKRYVLFQSFQRFMLRSQDVFDHMKGMGSQDVFDHMKGIIEEPSRSYDDIVTWVRYLVLPKERPKGVSREALINLFLEGFRSLDFNAPRSSGSDGVSLWKRILNMDFSKCNYTKPVNDCMLVLVRLVFIAIEKQVFVELESETGRSFVHPGKKPDNEQKAKRTSVDEFQPVLAGCPKLYALFESKDALPDVTVNHSIFKRDVNDSISSVTGDPPVQDHVQSRCEVSNSRELTSLADIDKWLALIGCYSDGDPSSFGKFFKSVLGIPKESEGSAIQQAVQNMVQRMEDEKVNLTKRPDRNPSEEPNEAARSDESLGAETPDSQSGDYQDCSTGSAELSVEEPLREDSSEGKKSPDSQNVDDQGRSDNQDATTSKVGEQNKTKSDDQNATNSAVLGVEEPLREESSQVDRSHEKPGPETQTGVGDQGTRNFANQDAIPPGVSHQDTKDSNDQRKPSPTLRLADPKTDVNKKVHYEEQAEASHAGLGIGSPKQDDRAEVKPPSQKLANSSTVDDEENGKEKKHLDRGQYAICLGVGGFVVAGMIYYRRKIQGLVYRLLGSKSPMEEIRSSTSVHFSLSEDNGGESEDDDDDKDDPIKDENHGGDKQHENTTDRQNLRQTDSTVGSTEEYGTTDAGGMAGMSGTVSGASRTNKNHAEKSTPHGKVVPLALKSKEAPVKNNGTNALVTKTSMINDSAGPSSEPGGYSTGFFIGVTVAGIAGVGVLCIVGFLIYDNMRAKAKPAARKRGKRQQEEDTGQSRIHKQQERLNRLLPENSLDDADMDRILDGLDRELDSAYENSEEEGQCQSPAKQDPGTGLVGNDTRNNGSREIPPRGSLPGIGPSGKMTKPQLIKLMEAKIKEKIRRAKLALGKSQTDMISELKSELKSVQSRSYDEEDHSCSSGSEGDLKLDMIQPRSTIDVASGWQSKADIDDDDDDSNDDGCPEKGSICEADTAGKEALAKALGFHDSQGSFIYEGDLQSRIDSPGELNREASASKRKDALGVSKGAIGESNGGEKDGDASNSQTNIDALVASNRKTNTASSATAPSSAADEFSLRSPKKSHKGKVLASRDGVGTKNKVPLSEALPSTMFSAMSSSAMPSSAMPSGFPLSSARPSGIPPSSVMPSGIPPSSTLSSGAWRDTLNTESSVRDIDYSAYGPSTGYSGNTGYSSGHDHGASSAFSGASSSHNGGVSIPPSDMDSTLPSEFPSAYVSVNNGKLGMPKSKAKSTMRPSSMALPSGMPSAFNFPPSSAISNSDMPSEIPMASNYPGGSIMPSEVGNVPSEFVSAKANQPAKKG